MHSRPWLFDLTWPYRGLIKMLHLYLQRYPLHLQFRYHLHLSCPLNPICVMPFLPNRPSRMNAGNTVLTAVYASTVVLRVTNGLSVLRVDLAGEANTPRLITYNLLPSTLPCYAFSSACPVHHSTVNVSNSPATPFSQYSIPSDYCLSAVSFHTCPAQKLSLPFVDSHAMPCHYHSEPPNATWLQRTNHSLFPTSLFANQCISCLPRLLHSASFCLSHAVDTDESLVGRSRYARCILRQKAHTRGVPVR